MHAATFRGNRTSTTDDTTARPRPDTEGDSPGTARIPRPRRPLDDVTEALNHAAQAPAAARHTAQLVLQAWQSDEETSDAVVLVVSELVTNAVEHARPPFALHLHREHAGSRIWVGVTDGGPVDQNTLWTTSCAPDEHGRSLGVVQALADGYGARTHSTGHVTHWARIPATA
ncbi:ATP-binding protein [Streptomyces sp. NBC_00233]|uniref:ATP-binding protein n=1 Tax=Streptomyces sp. NBC_00233 TaxID=2975686 RepID=UPI00225995D0|nr:ATP-binding protein [Streptomyces sp. NBC_00233]MCX5233223.1 ATP-binding protein [Streptomyces sp. NBC_00233]